MNWIALLSFALITTYTPGPNNISSASMGILYGYRKSFPYLLGIVCGFSLMMFLSGWVSGMLLVSFPRFEQPLRIAGAIYICWLAYHTLRASLGFEVETGAPLGFSSGLFLQLLNPKAIIYGLTMYTSFLSLISARPILLALSALLLGLNAFGAVSVWALFGAAIRGRLHQRRLRQIVSGVLAGLLLLTAAEIIGLI